MVMLRPGCALGASAVFLWACIAGAQTPATKGVQVEERSSAPNPSLQQQQRTSAAYRALEQARFESKLAEQDYVNGEEVYRDAQKRADALKDNLAKIAKARAAAKEKETVAAKAYDAALNAGGAR
jgi:hypothetical protein